ncbi:MAG: hypothetical protein EXS38_02700 [Opitutus sp.]|nr:hypothetical protein [Opitutus sp.]
MKYLRFALILSFFTFGVARAQDEERQAPPTEIPDFSNLDEFIYEPKSILNIGVRHLSSAKTTFFGRGLVLSTLDEPGPAKGINLTRHYHDGTVEGDQRVAARTDNAGNPLKDSAAGAQIFDTVAPDGRTNKWAFSDSRQLTDNGYIVYHTYSAEVIDTARREKETNSTNGMDISVARDMGKLFGSRISWNLIAGMSVNDLSSDRRDPVRANVTAQSDYFSLFGATPPSPPYASPSTANVNLLTAGGTPLTTDDGTTLTTTADTSILISNEPVGRVNVVTTDETSVNNRWKLKGAFYTFRAGPTLNLPVFSRLRATLSFGPALIYAGTNYTVMQVLTPEIGSVISDTSTNSTYRLIPAYFADAALEFDITERTGFYAAAVFQSASGYSQNLDNAAAHYSTKVDLSNMNGLRAGLSYRF